MVQVCGPAYLPGLDSHGNTQWMAYLFALARVQQRHSGHVQFETPTGLLSKQPASYSSWSWLMRSLCKALPRHEKIALYKELNVQKHCR